MDTKNCFFGEQESFEEELAHQLEISPDEVIMFGAGVHGVFLQKTDLWIG